MLLVENRQARPVQYCSKNVIWKNNFVGEEQLDMWDETDEAVNGSDR